MAEVAHKSEQTGNASIDRIQNNVRTLVAYVRSLEWLRRRAYVAATADVTLATAAAYAELIKTTITSDMVSSFLVVHFTASGLHITAQGTTLFRVVVDGTVAEGAWTTVAAGFAFSMAILTRVSVKAGLHNVVLEWRTDANSAQINASTAVEHHASMSVHEEA